MWVPPEISQALLSSLWLRLVEAWWGAAPWALGAAAFWWVSRRWLSRPLGRALTRRAVIAVGVIAALAWALHLGWIGDDAFISFRYARHWVRGAGLVFNPGERVEGYTNFLWIVLLGPFEAWGIPLAPASLVLSLACFVLTLLVTARFARQLWAAARVAPSRATTPFPIATVLLGLNYTFASFGTSGLETMLTTLLVLLAIERAERGAALSAGTFAILATLAHPDQGIVYACLALTWLIPERRLRELARFAAPFVVIYVPYFAWRWSYYGDPFPNTYYAKNAGLFYFSQGARYLALSGMSSGLWAALPLGIYGMARLWHLRSARFCAFVFPLFLLYVAKIGGDFMLGRLLCPLLPPLYIMAELGLRALAHHERLRRWASPAFALLCTVAVPVRFIQARENYAHVADERTFYPIASYIPFELDNAYWHWAHAFNRTFRDLPRPPTLAMFSVGIVGYETDLPLVDNAGLNHRGVAHWKNRRRGRPGHEKIISPAMLVASGADLSDVAPFPEPYAALGRVTVDGVRFHTVKYDEALFEGLAAAGVRTPPLLEYIDTYVPAAAPERLACDLWHMQQIYFSHARAPSRRRELSRKLAQARPEWLDYGDFLLAEPGAASAAWEPVQALSFDLLGAHAVLTGDAFLNNPASREGLGQFAIAGTRGRFINSYQEDSGNGATGTYTSEPFRIAGDVITLQVGGGHDPRALYVELEVGGERRFHATGCNSEIAGPRLWVTRGLRGQFAQLRVVDRARGDFGHIILDDLIQWRPRAPRQSTLQGESAFAAHPGEE